MSSLRQLAASAPSAPTTLTGALQFCSLRYRTHTTARIGTNRQQADFGRCVRRAALVRKECPSSLSLWLWACLMLESFAGGSAALLWRKRKAVSARLSWGRGQGEGHATRVTRLGLAPLGVTSDTVGSDMAGSDTVGSDTVGSSDVARGDNTVARLCAAGADLGRSIGCVKAIGPTWACVSRLTSYTRYCFACSATSSNIPYILLLASCAFWLLLKHRQ